MLPTLTDKLVYIMKFVLNGQPRSLVLQPIDAANGVIIEETSDGSGIYWGKTIGGSRVEVPVESVTHVFASWWKVSDNFGGNGNQTIHTNSEDLIDDHVRLKQDDPKAWDEHGELKTVKGEDKPPEGGKVIRR